MMIFRILFQNFDFSKKEFLTKYIRRQYLLCCIINRVGATYQSAHTDMSAFLRTPPARLTRFLQVLNKQFKLKNRPIIFTFALINTRHNQLLARRKRGNGSNGGEDYKLASFKISVPPSPPRVGGKFISIHYHIWWIFTRTPNTHLQLLVPFRGQCVAWQWFSR